MVIRAHLLGYLQRELLRDTPHLEIIVDRQKRPTLLCKQRHGREAEQSHTKHDGFDAKEKPGVPSLVPQRQDGIDAARA